MKRIWHRRDSGFVLVNALVLVAAMAAVAAVLLMRAEQGRSRLEAGQGADQLHLYLDAVEAQAIATLARDRTTGAVDAAGDDWAADITNVAVDRGQVSGQLRDMQGLFNINWLVEPENTQARAAFDRLMSSISVQPSVAGAIVAFVQPGGPVQTQAYLRRIPPLRPTGGPILTLDQLAQIPLVTPRVLMRLQTVATALPGFTQVNINTSPRVVLASLLPGLSPAQLTTLVTTRDAQPYTSVTAFVQQAELMLGATLDGILPAERLSVGSAWFQVDATATLGGRHATRRALLFRQGLPAGITTYWRVTVRP